MTALPPAVQNLIDLRTPKNTKSTGINVKKLELYNKAFLTDADFPLDIISYFIQLEYLDLHHCNFKSIPEAIKQLVSLTHLDMSCNQITDINLKGAGLTNLRTLKLNDNSITGVTGISVLSSLTLLDLHNNKLTAFLFGIQNLAELTSLDLSYNNLIGAIPIELEQLKKLFTLKLMCNKGLTGNIPRLLIRKDNKDCIRNLTEGNWSLQEFGGIHIKRSTIVKCDHLLILLYVIIGLFDYFIDIAVIYVLAMENQYPVMILNIIVMLVHFILNAISYLEGETLCEKIKDLALIFFQLKLILEAYKSSAKELETENFVALKKFDAISRSTPSCIIQTFSLLIITRNNTVFNYGNSILITSIISSVCGIAFTLASNHDESGHTMFNWKYVICFIFHLAEIIYRTLSIAVFFLALATTNYSITGFDAVYFGFCVLFIDFLIRFIVGVIDDWHVSNNLSCFHFTNVICLIVRSVCWMVSDTVLDEIDKIDYLKKLYGRQDKKNSRYTLEILRYFSLLETIIFTVFFALNPFQSKALQNLTFSTYLAIILIIVIAVFVKYLVQVVGINYLIRRYKKREEGEKNGTLVNKNPITVEIVSLHDDEQKN